MTSNYMKVTHSEVKCYSDVLPGGPEADSDHAISCGSEEYIPLRQ